MSRPFGLQDDVVTFSIEVRYVHLWAVHLEFWCPTLTGIFSPPMGVEIGYWLRNGLRIEFVVDVEILSIWDVVLVFDHDLCLFLERHREIAIQCSTTAVAMAFLWLAGNRDRERRKVTGNRVADTKEKTQRRRNE